MSKTSAQQIIQDIDTRYPNTYSQENKITWINNTLKQIYMDLALQDFYCFETVKGQRVYTLPDDCSMENIKNVEKSSRFKTATNSDWGRFYALKNSLRNQKMYEESYYDATEGCIGIYPVPNQSYRINIYYNKKPKMSTSLEDYIELDERFIDLVTYNVISVIATSSHNPDTEIANQYILLYNNLIQQANESKYEDQQKYPVVRNEKNYNRRRKY